MLMNYAGKIVLYALIFLLLSAPFYLIYDYVSFRMAAPGDQSAEQLGFTAHTTRLKSTDATSLSIKTAKMRFSGSGEPPPLVVIAPVDDPFAALYALRLSAPPVRAAHVLLPPDQKPCSEAISEIEELTPTGAGSNGIQILLLGSFTSEIQSIFSQQFNTHQISAADNERLALKLQEFLDALNLNSTSERVLLISEDDYRFGLPLATWLTYTGDPIFPLRSDGPSQAVTETLQKLEDQLPKGTELNLYLTAPLHLASNTAAEDLGRLGQITRVAGATPEQHSLAVARYFDTGTQFGWYSEQTQHSDKILLLGNPRYPAQLLASAQVLSEAWTGPTLLTSDWLCPAVETFLWSIRPSWTLGPTGSPFNHTLIAGDEEAIPWPVQARINYINTAAPYLTHDQNSVSGLEALFIVWLGSSWVIGLWIWCHSVMRRQQMNQLVRLLWVLAGLTVGPVGLLAYYLSYIGDKPPISSQPNRTISTSAISQSAALVSFTVGMIAAARFSILTTTPQLALTTGSIFWFGNPRIWSVTIGYFLAAGLGILLIEPGIRIKNSASNYRQILKSNWFITFSMITLASIIFAAALWWFEHLYILQPPAAGRVAWWGGTSLAGVSALIFTLPLGYYWALNNQKYDVF